MHAHFPSRSVTHKDKLWHLTTVGEVSQILSIFSQVFTKEREKARSQQSELVRFSSSLSRHLFCNVHVCHVHITVCPQCTWICPNHEIADVQLLTQLWVQLESSFASKAAARDALLSAFPLDDSKDYNNEM